MTDLNSEASAVLELMAMLLAEPRTAVLVGLLIAAAWTDFCTGRIPNAVVFGGTVLGLAFNALLPPFQTTPLEATLMSALGVVFGLIVMMPFYLLRTMGAGDVKLMAMSGAFLGFPSILPAVLGSLIAGGVLSLAWLAVTGKARRAWNNIQRLTLNARAGQIPVLAAKDSAGTMPYGVAIAAGTIGYLAVRQLGLLH